MPNDIAIKMVFIFLNIFLSFPIAANSKIWNTRTRNPYSIYLYQYPPVTVNLQTKKVSEPTFLHQIKRCFGILFGLSAQVIMAFIFDINTNLNEIYKEMS
jgi:hypothetical protein